MEKAHFDVGVVGAGIVGLAHAYLAARAGQKVVVFERSPRAMGASLRNFGMIWPIGQPAAALHTLALRSRELWLEVLNDARLPYRATGSLHATYGADEAEVGQEFAAVAPGLGYECEWLGREAALARSPALEPEGLMGALWSPVEMTVDPRVILRRVPEYLRERYGVQFCFGTAVQAVEPPLVVAGGERWAVEQVVLAAGEDTATLFAQALDGLGLTRCKLQMMRTTAQPPEFGLGPALAFGLSFRHYPSFGIAKSLAGWAARVAEETPEFDRWGIHVMVSETADGALTLGDSHQYGDAVDIFDRPEINRLILHYARQRLRVPRFEIEQTWHGVYPKHPEHAYLRYAPAANVTGVVVTSGAGMTLSFGLAEETLRQMGVGQ